MKTLEKVFQYQGKQVRTLSIEGDPWFVAKDVCDVLEHSDTSKAVGRLDDDEKLIRTLFVSGQNREVWIVNEPGLYSLILTSRKPEARLFRRWITHEVIPSIRKTGGYVANEDLFIDTYLPHADDHTKLLFRATLETVRKQNEMITVMEPKAAMFDVLLSGENTQSMGEVAKSFGIGRNKLFAFLRSIGVLMASNNTPYQQYMDAGYFEVIEVPRPMGCTITNIPTTRVTAKGIDFIGRKLRQHGLIKQKEVQ